jgi:hypothetical protein
MWTTVYAYVGFGMSMSLGIKGLRVAIMLLIPSTAENCQHGLQFLDRYDQYFSIQVHFSNFGEWGKKKRRKRGRRKKRIDGLLGASYSPWDWISVGMSGN